MEEDVCMWMLNDRCSALYTCLGGGMGGALTHRAAPQSVRDVSQSQEGVKGLTDYLTLVLFGQS